MCTVAGLSNYSNRDCLAIFNEKYFSRFCKDVGQWPRDVIEIPIEILKKKGN